MSSSASKLFPLAVAAFRFCLGVETCHSGRRYILVQRFTLVGDVYSLFHALSVNSLVVGSLASC